MAFQKSTKDVFDKIGRSIILEWTMVWLVIRGRHNLYSWHITQRVDLNSLASITFFCHETKKPFFSSWKENIQLNLFKVRKCCFSNMSSAFFLDLKIRHVI